MLPQICEPLEFLTWDAEGEVLLSGYTDMFSEAVINRGRSTSIPRSTRNQFCVIQ